MARGNAGPDDFRKRIQSKTAQDDSSQAESELIKQESFQTRHCCSLDVTTDNPGNEERLEIVQTFELFGGVLLAIDTNQHHGGLTTEWQHVPR